MAFIIHKSQELSRPDLAGKVIKGDDYWSYQTAKDLISSANKKRDEIIDAAIEGFEAEQKRGYREGLEQARLEQASKMIGVISQTVEYFGKIESQMVDLVLDAVRRIVDDFDDREKVVKVVRTSLTMVRNQRQISIRVHPENIAEVKSQINHLKTSFPGIEQMEVISDVNLAKDACVIESDMGQVEASLTGQMEALRHSFSRVFGVAPEETRTEKAASTGTDTSRSLLID
jgi:type III secretion protein L